MIVRIAVESDIERVLQLQSLNLYSNLSPAELAQGFVTTPITVEQIKSIMAQTGLFVVEHKNLVIGYAYAGSWDYFAQWAIFPYMLSRLTQIDFQGVKITTANSFQYGPVCIERAWRGSGAFPQLFQAMRSSLAANYPIGITFINQINQRSLKAHRKLDLEIIDEFRFNDCAYYSLAFPTTIN
jgi:hypothetical protein